MNPGTLRTARRREDVLKMFYVNCNSLIDTTHGRVLSGEDLERARITTGWPRCGNKVEEGSKFCGRCWSTTRVAAQERVKCPRCGKLSGIHPRRCRNCDSELHPELPPEVESGRWQKSPRLLAQRLEIGDVKKFLLRENGITIKAGTSAILGTVGDLPEVLPAGAYNLENLAELMQTWGDPPPRSVILIDSEDITVPVLVRGFRSSRGASSRVYAEVKTRFAGDSNAARLFLANAMESKTEFSYLALEELIKTDFVQVVNNLIEHSPARILPNYDLYPARRFEAKLKESNSVIDLESDPDTLFQLDYDIQRRLKHFLNDYGFEIGHVSPVELIYAIRDKHNQRLRLGVEKKRRSIEFDQLVLNMLSPGEMAKFKSEDDIENYVKLLAEEREVPDEQRNHNLLLLKLYYLQIIDSAAAEFALLLEMTVKAHSMSARRTEKNYLRRAERLKKDNPLAVAAMRKMLIREKRKQRIAGKSSRGTNGTYTVLHNNAGGDPLIAVE